MNLYHNADFNAIHKEVQKLTQAAELGLAKNRHSAFAYGFEAKTEIKRSSTKLKTKNSNSSQNIFQHEPSKVYNPTKKLTSSTNNPNERHLQSADTENKNQPTSPFPSMGAPEAIQIKNPLSQMILAEDGTILIPLNTKVKSKLVANGSTAL